MINLTEFSDDELASELARRTPEYREATLRRASTAELMYTLVGRDDIGKYGPSLEEFIEMLRKVW